MIIWGKIKIVSFPLHPKALRAGYPIRPHKYTSAENRINRWKSQEKRDSCLARAHTVCSGLNWTPEAPDCSDQGLPIPAPQQGSMQVLGSRCNSWAGTWLSKGQGEWLLSTFKMTYSKLYQKPSDSECSEDCLFIFTCWAPAQVPGMSSRNLISGECILSNSESLKT